MLQIVIPETELYDEGKNQFFTTKSCTLQLEHSLVSLSKWESKWKKPFLTKKEKTVEESIDYIRCMTMTQNIDPDVYQFIQNDVIQKVNEYIEDPMTATTFSKDDKGPNREIVTAEIIYYWMILFGIPFECQKWHLNKLLTLINVCNIKNRPHGKMSRKEVYSRNTALNAIRRKNLNSSG